MKNIKYQIAVAVVCLVLGIMVSIQFRTVKQGVGPVSEYRARELAAQLKKVREENVKLQNVKNDYESKIKEFEDTASQGSAYAKILKDELDQARIMAGIEDDEADQLELRPDRRHIAHAHHVSRILAQRRNQLGVDRVRYRRKDDRNVLDGVGARLSRRRGKRDHHIEWIRAEIIGDGYRRVHIPLRRLKFHDEIRPEHEASADQFVNDPLSRGFQSRVIDDRRHTDSEHRHSPTCHNQTYQQRDDPFSHFVASSSKNKKRALSFSALFL